MGDLNGHTILYLEIDSVENAQISCKSSSSNEYTRFHQDLDGCVQHRIGIKESKDHDLRLQSIEPQLLVSGMCRFHQQVYKSTSDMAAPPRVPAV